MVSPSKPQKIQANGKDSWFWVPAIANIQVPKITEINAVSGVNISCYLLAEQEGVTSTTEKVRLARLLCETSTTEGLGEQTWSLADITGVFDPQAASGSLGKKAWELFQDPVNPGYLARRQGVVAYQDTPEAAVGQFFDIFKVEASQATPGKTANDASGIYSFTAGVALLDQAFNVAAVAGP
ncbi:hypothetical protein F9L07_19670 [Pimelobacter simplex]|uniref:Uncharacterized protein n=1 Tax=Nocardioides simplex TaxID=2045 RepID=A0A7J5DVH2_NOCSI|nr:hypothetical protein [Pimelobacter simplex]KAB2809262.1 hypothetical protein F9L07_19670 [Pimelobacter simplex]